MTTNRERLNKMTNEELASLLISDCFCYCIAEGWDNCGEISCTTNIVKWLESEE